MANTSFHNQIALQWSYGCPNLMPSHANSIPMSEKTRPIRETRSSMVDCLFCDRMSHPASLESRLVYEDEYFHASHHVGEEGPHLLGVVLIQSRRHVNDLSELSETEAMRLGTLVKGVSGALKSAVGASWTYCYSFMEGVRHVHVFVTARYPGVPPEYVRLSIGDWPEAPVGSIAQVNDLSARLKSLVSGVSS